MLNLSFAPTSFGPMLASPVLPAIAVTLATGPAILVGMTLDTKEPAIIAGIVGVLNKKKITCHEENS